MTNTRREFLSTISGMFASLIAAPRFLNSMDRATLVDTAQDGAFLSPIVRNGLWGFIDTSSLNLVLDFQFEKASIFREGLSVVRYAWTNEPLGKKHAYINSHGKFAIQIFEAVRANEFHEGLALVETWDDIERIPRFGYIDKNGDTAIPFQFEDGKDFNFGFAAVQRNSKWGLINRQGKIWAHGFTFENPPRRLESGTVIVEDGDRFAQIVGDKITYFYHAYDKEKSPG